MITNKEIELSLRQQTLCPKCGVSWTELEDSLYEGIVSENYQIARIVLDNCKVCQMRFQKELERLGG